MNLQEIINQYFSLTGRPVSTMSVTEYLQFVSAAEMSHGTYESRHTETAEPYREDTPDKKSAYTAPEPAKKPVAVQPAKKKSSEETKLALLKSVSG